MIDVEWNDNAKAAVDCFADWLRADYSYIANLEDFYSRLPQPKTVADAVEYLNDTMQGRWFSDYNYLCYREDNHWFYSDKSSDDVVCTHAEFEAYVKEQEGDKWTHIGENGIKCRLVSDEPDYDGFVPTIKECGGYYIQFLSELKPIKPTMTEAQQEMVAKFIARIYKKGELDLRSEFDEFCNEHDII